MNDSDCKTNSDKLSIGLIQSRNPGAQNDNTLFRHLLCVSKIGGYHSSFLAHKILVATYMITIVIILLHEALNKEDGYPSGLNIYIGLMEFETFVLYLFGVYHIDYDFVSQLAQHLSFINACYPKKKLHFKLFYKELLIICCWILVLYFTGYIGEFNINELKQKSSVWWYMWYATNIVDIVRFVPIGILIMFVRLYFITFQYELEQFRDSIGVLSRFNYIDNENPLLNIDGNNNNNMHFVKELKMSHMDFKNNLQRVMYPYRILCRKLRYLYICYLFLNTLCFIFVFITMIAMFLNENYKPKDFFYIHFIIEMSSHFLGWIMLMLPLANSHRLLRSLKRDIISTAIFENAQDQILVHQYLSICCDASPFSIGYITPTYSKLTWILHIVFVVIGGQLLSVLYFN